MFKTKILKTKTIRYSGRSSDYIAPSFLQGCYGGCKYCTAARHFPESFYGKYLISTNITEILDNIKSYNVEIPKPNQTDNKYITWDLACNADLLPVLHTVKWKEIFDYFKYSNRDKGTLATKFVNKKLLEYNPEGKIRVRMSLMPERASDIFEPKTAKVYKRIEFMNELYNAGYEVHINFSPVIFYKSWKKDYIELFNHIDKTINQEVKKQLACEVIFLTHNEKLHEFNKFKEFSHENLLWNPLHQEEKISKFGGKNVRYNYKLKKQLVKEFKELVKQYIPYCKIRYIF